MATKKVRDAWKTLDLEPTEDLTLLDHHWRVLRSELHPDKPTGDVAKFDAARKAYDLLRVEILKPKPCLDCDGLGKTKIGRGFNTIEKKCKTCKGSGFKESAHGQ